MTAARRKQIRSLKSKNQAVEQGSSAICRLWAYRLIVNQRLVAKVHDFFELDLQLAEQFGLKMDAQPLTVVQLQRYIAGQLRQLEQGPCPAVPEVLAKNIDNLGEMIGLNAVERQLLAFSVLVKLDPLLEPVSIIASEIAKPLLARVIASVLGVSELAVKQALKKNSALLSSGLVTLQPSPTLMINDLFEFISYNFSHHLFEDDLDPKGLLKDVLKQATPPGLSMAQYGHIKADLDILLPYLKTALAQQCAGVNVLIYGPPGTGKSELVRVLAKKLKLPLYEVSSEDEEGDAISGVNRLRAYRIAQRFLANTPNLLLFDEIEDVFVQNPFSRQAESRKGWMNQLLEQNVLPCFWVTNDHTVIDHAFIRRFDQVIKLDAPPKAQRQTLLQSALPGVLSDAEASQLADQPGLTPAIITRASRVVSHLPPRLTRSTKVAALQHLMHKTLQAQGYPLAADQLTDSLGPVYDASLVNADVNLLAITKGLKHAGSGRLCLYGPPGTGKTAFAHYLARQLHKPLLIKTASQLYGMFLGETEKLIAAAFAEAKDNDAVLLLDEVDSFLQDRRKAQQSWQISTVNELLVQMEGFNGVFVASTNLMQDLDQASLRRFDLKARFGFLKAEQAKQLFIAHCQQLGLTPCVSSVRQLSSLLQLTPGDFAAVVRQSRFRPFTQASDLVAALHDEMTFKEASAAKPIGFLQ